MKKQTKHNKAVESSAEYYKKNGYKVKADISGYKRPEIINKRRPDVIACKKKKTVIVEVETPDTLVKDKKQREAFKKHADEDKNTCFRCKLTK